MVNYVYAWWERRVMVEASVHFVACLDFFCVHQNIMINKCNYSKNRSELFNYSYVPQLIPI